MRQSQKPQRRTRHRSQSTEHHSRKHLALGNPCRRAQHTKRGGIASVGTATLHCVVPLLGERCGEYSRGEFGESSAHTNGFEARFERGFGHNKRRVGTQQLVEVARHSGTHSTQRSYTIGVGYLTGDGVGVLLERRGVRDDAARHGTLQAIREGEGSHGESRVGERQQAHNPRERISVWHSHIRWCGSGRPRFAPHRRTSVESRAEQGRELPPRRTETPKLYPPSGGCASQSP